jgi:cellulose synthase/poly-beta-1,6-N-acetylglucosamine synthase-like glycosyltransferase
MEIWHYFILGYCILSLGYLIYSYVRITISQPKEYPNFKGKVAIIIPSYNEEPKNLIKCIKSCLKQSYKEIEVIVIDDGSKKTSME